MRHNSAPFISPLRMQEKLKSFSATLREAGNLPLRQFLKNCSDSEGSVVKMAGKGARALASVPERIRVFVFLGHGFGASWSRGELPGINEQLPYGYYHASDNGCVVKYSLDAEESRVTRFLRLSMRRLVGFDLLHAWRNRQSLCDADVVWTHTELEHLAVLVLWRSIPRNRRPKLIAQCIWLFDKWDRLPAHKRWLYSKLLSQTNVLTLQSSENLEDRSKRSSDGSLPIEPVRNTHGRDGPGSSSSGSQAAENSFSGQGYASRLGNAHRGSRRMGVMRSTHRRQIHRSQTGSARREH